MKDKLLVGEIPLGNQTEMSPVDMARRGLSLTGEQARQVWLHLDNIISDRDTLRDRLLEVLPWVGRVSYPYTAGFSKMTEARKSAEEDVKRRELCVVCGRTRFGCNCDSECNRLDREVEK